MTKKRRTSHTSQGSNGSSGSVSDVYLSTRTRKSISKSRRSSAVEEKPPSRRTSIAAAISLMSLPSFHEQLSTSQFVNALDVHALYKVKVKRSNRKLEYFFGEPTPVDVCISEINKEGLKAMLASKVPLCYFLYYLLEEFSSENLFFFLEVEQFENQKKSPLTDIKEMAQGIFDTYISTTACLEVNLDDRVKRNITRDLAAMDSSNCLGLFNDAKVSVYIMLEASFNRFLHSVVYQDMHTHCGELTIHYSQDAIETAINYLLRYLRNQHDVVIMYSRDNTPLGDSLTEMNMKHYELTKSVLYGFIKDLFGSDFFASSVSSVSSASSLSSSSSTKSFASIKKKRAACKK